MGELRHFPRRSDNAVTALPAEQRWWTTQRYGLLLHPSISAVPAWAPIGQYAEWYRAHIDGSVRDTLQHPSPLAETLAHHAARWGHVAEFDDFVDLLTFDDFDPDAWAELAVDAGMSYTVMVAKHHDGLCWWDAPDTDFNVVRRGPKRDVLGEYSAACERAGLTLGTYYSLLDWHDPRYPGSAYVDDVVHPQVLDLVARYGTRLLWGDGHWGGGGSHWRSDDLIAAARAIEPALVVNDRWWADGPGVRSFEYRLPPDALDGPWEMRRGVGGSFACNRAEGAEHLITPHDLIALLTEVVAKGGHLLMGVGPDASGRIPDRYAAVLRSAGAWVNQHRRLIDHSQMWRDGGGASWGDAGCRYLVLDGRLHAIDVSGTPRFAALGLGAGTVTAVSRLIDGAELPVDFEQSAGGLTVAKPRRSHPAEADALGVAVYRIDVERGPGPPAALFPATATAPIELATLVQAATPGQIVQLGSATYVGPARIPTGVVVRGLGPDRTRIDGLESCAVTLEAGARIEHCTIAGGGTRIVWLPKPVVAVVGNGASLLGCRVDGHVECSASDVTITSCALTGVIAQGVDRVHVVRSSLSGMRWDCAVDVHGGAEHLIDGCTFDDVLEAVRLTATSSSTVRGNAVHARWFGVRAVDSEATLIAGNTFRRPTRAVDIDGGTQAVVTGNLASGGDSGCVVQRGATDVEVSGNRWERTRIGLLCWDAGEVRHHDNTSVALGEPDCAVTVGP